MRGASPVWGSQQCLPYGRRAPGRGGPLSSSGASDIRAVPMTAPPSRRGPVALLLALAVAVPCALEAWVSDDAFITLRVVDDVLAGRGAVWNVGQRVQVYTHPAWFALLVLVAGVTREFFVTPQRRLPRAQSRRPVRQSSTHSTLSAKRAAKPHVGFVPPAG